VKRSATWWKELELTHKEVRLLNSGDSFYFPSTCDAIEPRKTRLRVV